MRGYSFVDKNGGGYVYPMDFNDNGKDYEFQVEGNCYCCYECMKDDDCKDGKDKYCVENKCVGCKDDEQCSTKGMICNKGKCIDGICRDNDDCMKNEICNRDGECVEGCRSDKNCDTNKICMNRKCTKGCRIDNNDCENDKEMMCIQGECISNGCKVNYDCEYDEICINNKCMNTDLFEQCSDEKDCQIGHYCNYEYFICIENNLESNYNRRNEEILPAICSLNSVITLFFMAASYSIAVKNSEYLLKDECVKRCFADNSIDFKTSVTARNLLDRPMKREKKYLCSGICTTDSKLLTYLYKSAQKFKQHVTLHEQVVEFANDVCFDVEFSDTIITKNPRFVFGSILNLHCQEYTKEITHQSHSKLYRFLSRPCVADYETIKCFEVIDGKKKNIVLPFNKKS